MSTATATLTKPSLPHNNQILTTDGGGLSLKTLGSRQQNLHGQRFYDDLEKYKDDFYQRGYLKVAAGSWKSRYKVGVYAVGCQMVGVLLETNTRPLPLAESLKNVRVHRAVSLGESPWLTAVTDGRGAPEYDVVRALTEDAPESAEPLFFSGVVSMRLASLFVDAAALNNMHP